jgi:hypothetical protein
MHRFTIKNGLLLTRKSLALSTFKIASKDFHLKVVLFDFKFHTYVYESIMVARNNKLI